MNRLAKLLHLLGAAGFIGAIAAELAIARLADPAARPMIDTVSRFVLQPSLLLMITSGLLLIALRPAYFEQRWLWAKMLLLMSIAPIVWWQGPQAVAALGDAASRDLGGWAALLLSVAAVALAVWRPRLGQKEPSLP